MTLGAHVSQRVRCGSCSNSSGCACQGNHCVLLHEEHGSTNELVHVCGQLSLVWQDSVCQMPFILQRVCMWVCMGGRVLGGVPCGGCVAEQYNMYGFCHCTHKLPHGRVKVGADSCNGCCVILHVSRVPDVVCFFLRGQECSWQKLFLPMPG